MSQIQVYINARYIQGSCQLEFTQYHDGNPAIILHQDGQQAAKVTVNLTDAQRMEANLGAMEFAVKGWSENAELPECLIHLGILEDTGRRVDCGHTSAKICQLSSTAAASFLRPTRQQASA